MRGQVFRGGRSRRKGKDGMGICERESRGIVSSRDCEQDAGLAMNSGRTYLQEDMVLRGRRSVEETAKVLSETTSSTTNAPA